MALVWVPTDMRKFTGGQHKVTVKSGETLRDLMDNLEKKYPGIRGMVVHDQLIKAEIAVFVDGENIHQGLFQPVRENSEIHFLPMQEGG